MELNHVAMGEPVKFYRWSRANCHVDGRTKKRLATYGMRRGGGVPTLSGNVDWCILVSTCSTFCCLLLTRGDHYQRDSGKYDPKTAVIHDLVGKL